MIVAVTGHRPNKLWGYDLSHPKYNKLFQYMYSWLVQKKATHCISGMALGVDTVFALAVLQYRKDYPDLGVKLECAIPCRNQSNHWTEESKKLYDSILKVADIVTLVSDEDYKPWLMQKRNIYMVDKCDILLAVWDGSPGGTKNCVDYAKSKNKKIEYINPKYL